MNRWASVVPAAAALCLFAVLTWQVIAGGPVIGLDMPIYHWAYRHGAWYPSPLWVALSELGDGRITLPLAGALAAVVVWRRRMAAPIVVAAAAIGVAAAFVEIIKVVINRSNPGTASDAAFAGGAAFPSGHAASATVTWGAIAFLAFCLAGRRLRPSIAHACLAIGGFAGICAGAAMVRIGYHWLTDAVAGWLLGVLVLDLMLMTASSHLIAWLRCRPDQWPMKRRDRPSRAAASASPWTSGVRTSAARMTVVGWVQFRLSERRWGSESDRPGHRQ